MTDTASQAPGETPEPFTFVVYRDKWLRGDAWKSVMLNDVGGRCCLGFYGKALGMSDEDMIDEATPANCLSARYFPEWLVSNMGGDTNFASTLMNANDDDHDAAGEPITDEKREARVKELFASKGIVVEFRDGTGEEASL